MAVTWTSPSPPPPGAASQRIARAACTTGSEANTAPLTDGLDLRGLSAVQAHVETAAKAEGTITFKKLKPGDIVTVNGEVFTAVNPDLGSPTAAQFIVPSWRNAASDYIAAKSLAAAINADAALNVSMQAWVDPNLPVVTVQALADGAAGNAFTLAESTAGVRVTVSGATLAGGLASGGNIAAGATLQWYVQDPATQRWNRAADLDQPIPAGAAAATLPPVALLGREGRLQALPNGVGFACRVNLIGVAGRLP